MQGGFNTHLAPALLGLRLGSGRLKFCEVKISPKEFSGIKNPCLNSLMLRYADKNFHSNFLGIPSRNVTLIILSPDF